MLDACVEGDLLGGLEGMAGGGRDVLHLEAGEETAEMEGRFCEAVVNEPLAHPTDHVHIVVDGRNDEVRQFDPHARIAHGEDGVEHGGEVAATDLLVDVVAERFQVDVGSIEVGQEVSEWLLTDVTSRDEDVPKAFLMCQTRRVRHIFYIGKWLGIGIGDARAMVLLAEADNLLRREVVVIDIIRSDLRNLVVLTVLTTEVTACAGERETGGARMEVVERLLLDGIDG